FRTEPQIVYADIDLERLRQDRMRMTSFNDAASRHCAEVRSMRRVRFGLQVPSEPVILGRALDRFPFVPNNDEERESRCFDAFHIQVQGLVTRMKAASIDKIVIGVSGGLDSTHALLIAVKAVDSLGFPRTNVLGYSLPGPATSRMTRENAKDLMESLGVTTGEIDISPAAEQMLEDIDHPVSRGESTHDTTYENVQAGARTSLLFRLANQNGALVLGTGDLSELALGWTTYGVGDQMSHYNVNASVPKTLIQFMLRWAIDTCQFNERASEILGSVLETEISPELVPHPDPDAQRPGADSEKVVGPYELQDFFLYQVLRFGYSPSKVAFLAHHAWGDRSIGRWPDLIPEARRNEYSLAEIKQWLGVFLERFFHTSQFKRSAMPNSPKVGSGGALSPRGDWRAPSDGSAAMWLAELNNGVPDET
ncbi:MAG: NAD(+) synthase, partial [Solirubrobacteraceae bacterium]